MAEPVATSPANTAASPRIHASTMHLDELVDRAMRGRIRVPSFQRGLRWTEENVQELFDSLYRGYPIGTLLMWQRPAEAQSVKLGPITFDAPAVEDAWWVVDGQQRLTSLVAGLRHPDPSPGLDPFSVYFDLDRPPGSGSEASAFFRPHRQRRLTDLDLPMAAVLDGAALQQWIFDAVQKTGRRDVIAAASEVATRIRNYRVPVYVVETDDPETARDIFLRTNRSGRRMEMHEVFAALAPVTTPADADPEKVAERLSASFGELEPNVVVKAAHALVGDQVTRGPGASDGPQRDVWMRRTEVATRRALEFLVTSDVPHLRLLPARLTPVVVLARFFDRFERPHERTLRLLRRWLWRGFFTESLASDARTFRRAVVAVGEDEDASVQRLLAQVPVSEVASVELPARFDARHGPSRLAMLAMSHARPWSVVPELELFEAPGASGVFDWLQRHGGQALARLDGVAAVGPEARFLTPGASSRDLKSALSRWAREDVAHPALASHLIPPAGAAAWLEGRLDDFIALRRAHLVERLRELFLAYAEPGHSDRPPLSLDPLP